LAEPGIDAAQSGEQRMISAAMAHDQDQPVVVKRRGINHSPLKRRDNEVADPCGKSEAVIGRAAEIGLTETPTDLARHGRKQ